MVTREVGVTNERTVALSLGQMWVAGASYLPRAGDLYASLSKQADCTDNSGTVFNRYGTIAGTPVSGTFPGAVFPIWENVRDTLQQMLAESAKNLYEAGKLVLHVAELFAATDDDIARTFAAEKLKYQQDPDFAVRDPATWQPPAMPSPYEE
jgi:hypothetical protein